MCERSAELDRLMAKVKTSVDGCWLWTGTLNPDGYGRCGFRGNTGIQAHRALYTLLVEDIPAGMHLDHLCHTRECVEVPCSHRRCVHPGHLKVTTPGANVLRGNGLGALNAIKTECDSGHPFNELNTYWRPDGSRCCRPCRRAAGRRHDIKRRSA